MDNYELVVASYVYSFLNADWEEIDDEEAMEILRDVIGTHVAMNEDSGWEELVATLSSAEGRLKALRNRTDDPETKKVLTAWMILVTVLTAVALIRLKRYEKALKTVERAYRIASRVKYIEPYIISASLMLSLKFRLGKRVDSTTLQAIAFATDEPHLRALAFEILARVFSDISSDAAFFYVLLYWESIRDLKGIDLLVLLERLYHLLDVVMLRLMYEIRSGKVLSDQVDWSEEVNELFDWLEEKSEDEMLNIGMVNLYVRLLHYVTLRSDFLRGDPFNVADRLRRANRRIRESIEALLKNFRDDDEDDGKYDSILKA